MHYTVLGATGFVGRRLTAALRAAGADVFVPVRDDPGLFDRDLGHVIYCVGLTADFDKNAAATVEAHTGLIARIAERARFDHIVYLSSTRLYDLLTIEKADGRAVLPMEPQRPRHLYDLSKALGENLCLCQKRAPSAVARLSGVYDWTPGAPGFLSEWLQRAAHERRFVVDSASGVIRDYIHLDDVVRALMRISATKANGIFNVASGENISNGEILDIFNGAGFEITLARQSDRQKLPVCDIAALTSLGVVPQRTRDVIMHWMTEELSHDPG